MDGSETTHCGSAHAQVQASPVENPGAADHHYNRKLILMDDDPVFGNIMAAVARQMGVELHYYTSLLDLGYTGRLCDYDAAIVDYDLGDLCGLEVGEYMSALLGDMPVLLVSGVYRGASDPVFWSPEIKAFMPKSSGYGAIVEAVCHLLDDPQSAARPQPVLLPRHKVAVEKPAAGSIA